MNSDDPTCGSTPPSWLTTLSISFDEGDERNATRGGRLWPTTRWRFRDPGGATELELRFDDTVQALLAAFARAAIHASEGDRSLARHAQWSFTRDGERIDRGEGPVVLRPLEGNVIAIDLVAFDDPDEASVGRLDSDVGVRSRLPEGPVPVRFVDVLEELAEAGTDALELYRGQDASRTDPAESLAALVCDVEAALEAVDDGAFAGFDASLERYVDLLLENPTTAEAVHGPIRDEWLIRHALETDAIERLIDERIRPADAETARRWYKALFTGLEDEVTKRTLSALAADPDQRAIGGLLLFLWDDDPQFAPRAIEILGTLLATHEAFEDARAEYDHVLEQVEKRSERSEHARVRAAAVEALERVDG